MDESREEAIQKINTRFYNAFESLSLENMEVVWKHSDDIVCIHPGWDLFSGWMAVRESWMTVFQNVVAVVVCLENIQSNVNQSKSRMGVVSTNIFERQLALDEYNNEHNEKWLMIHHHGSP